MVPDKKDFRKRVLLRILSSPWTLLPFVTGASILLLTWALGAEAKGWLSFTGITFVLGAIGSFFSRLVLSSESESQKVIEKIREEQLEQKENEFKELERKLQLDGDSRTENYLRDLRVLTDQFIQSNSNFNKNSLNLDVYSSMEISMKVDELFRHSVKSLTRTYDLWQTANNLQSKKAKAPLLEVREKLIKEVGKTIEQLGKSLANIEKISTSPKNTESDLARIRTELDKQIKTAEKVSHDISELDYSGESFDEKLENGKYDEFMPESSIKE